MYLTFAWRYFKAKKNAHAINIIAWITVSVIAFATCCQVLVLSVFNGFEDLVKSLYSSFYPDIKIISSKGKTFVFTPEQIILLKQQSFIKKFSLVVEEKALLQNNDTQIAIYLKGVDNNYSKVSGVFDKVVTGKYITGTADEPCIIVGSGIRNTASINMDPAIPSGTLTIILPKKNDNNDPMQSISEGNVNVSGIFSIQQEFDEKYAITNIDFIKQQTGIKKDEYSSIEIKLKTEVNLTDSKYKLSKLLGDNYTLQTTYEQNTGLYNTMQLEKWAIYGVLTLILIVAAFNMISALTMLVLEKRKDITILQSMGASQKKILNIFLMEGLLLGSIGTLIGIILAISICLLQIKFKLIKLNGSSFLINYFPVKIVISDFFLITLTALIIAFIASWFPAYKASRQKFSLR